MYIVIGILAGIIILQFIIMWKFQRQVKDICRQLAFMMKHDSNMLINHEFDVGGIGKLSDRLSFWNCEEKRSSIIRRKKL